MPSTAVFSFRLPGERAQSLKRIARRLRRSAAEVAAQFVDEATRQAEFASIEFRDSALGRQAYVRGSRLAVWQVVKLVDAYREDVTRTAEHLRWPEARVKAALNYAHAFREEISQAIEDARSFSAEKLSQLLPSLEVVDVPTAALKAR
jgi:uncharacterized protein (DUF433 family)